MKLFTGWVLAAGLAFGATAAEAQVVGPSRVSDFGGPYVDAPYRGGPYYRRLRKSRRRRATAMAAMVRLLHHRLMVHRLGTWLRAGCAGPAA